ncbi:uncharacterized protein LOC124114240 [Haliotis rufescens]|uniref:uncharacterized protein LOC124114240 n=1 Tax=Haliotis rufescens TaxID=6454 RepID=UPI001EB0552A|nr:uncharacterized protein LOC124114240 [Haliotis rufescens]
MFKRSINFSPFEKDQLLRLIREYIVIFEDKRLDGVGRREKERAWLELTDRYNSLENVNLRTSKQLQACWKNLKNRAKDVTEACKRGDEFPFFTMSNNLNSSYLPFNSFSEDENGYEIRVKAERNSDDEDAAHDDFTVTFNAHPQPYSVSNSPSPLPESGPVNYVYSPTASTPSLLIPPSSSHVLSSSVSALASSPSRSPPREGPPDEKVQRLERSVPTRLPCSVPTYKAPERSISKSVDRIATSILFERGVYDHPGSQGLLVPRLSDAVSSEGNLPPRDNWMHNHHQHCNTSPPQYKNAQRFNSSTQPLRKGGNSHRPITSSRPMASNTARASVNGHVPLPSPRKMKKAAQYRRLEHEVRMKNLKFERNCVEAEHKLKCELLQLKIKYYKNKLDEERCNRPSQADVTHVGPE